MKYPTTLLFLLFSSFAFAQQSGWQWAKGLPTRPNNNETYHNAEDQITKVAVDNDGNVYLAGLFSDTVSQSGYSIICESGYSNENIFLGKYDKDGTLQWLKSFGSHKPNFLTSITVDPQNNIYVAGTFIDTLIIEDTIILSRGESGFLIKYSSDGSFHWVRTCNPGSSILWGISADENGIWATGEYSTKHITYLDTTQLSNSGFFIAKFNFDGTLALISSLENSTEGLRPFNISSDHHGGCYITGIFSTQFPSIRIGNDTIFSKSKADCFLMRVDSSLTPLWVKAAHSNIQSVDAAYVYVAANKNSVCTYGYFRDSIRINTELFTTNVYISLVAARFASDGNFDYAWVPEDGGSFLYQYDICADSTNSYYIAGTYSGKIILGTKEDSNSTFVAKLDASHEVSLLLSPSQDTNYSCRLTSVAINKNNDPVVSGQFKRTISFGNTTLIPKHSPYPNYFATNAFVAKYSYSLSTSSQHKDSLQIFFYPNPSISSVFFKYSVVNSVRVLISLYNLLGEKVYFQDEGILSAGEHETTLDLHGLASGMYLVRLMSGNEIRTGYIQVIH
jgi:hypothetical protein